MYFRRSLYLTVMSLSCALFAWGARAGGFDNDQSAYFQGMSLAGLAAGGSSVSSMFWNPAASAFAGPGLTMESSYSLILPSAELTVLNPEEQLPPPGAAKVDIGRDALTLASASAKRLNDKTVVGLSMSSPFGLATKPDDVDWSGKYHSLTSKLFTLNVTPSVSYQLTPTIAVGVGMQIDYLEIPKIRAQTPLGLSTLRSDELELNNFGLGFTAGINVNPTPGTSIGLGYRSPIQHDIEGEATIRFNSTAALLGLSGRPSAPIKAELELPEKLTLSFRQVVSPTTRLLGTVMWTNWDRLDVVPVILTGPFDSLAPAGVPVANFDFQWHDAWFFALGGEYDWSQSLTLRTGLAYELSPIHSATERPIQNPDSNRWLASIGASYKWTEAMSVDFSYMHLFYDDAPFDRIPASTLLPPEQSIHLIGKTDVDVDIIAIGFKMRLGAAAPKEALK